MSQIIKDKIITDNEWLTVSDDDSLPAGKVIISLSRWLTAEGEAKEQLTAKRDAGELGVSFSADQTADQLGSDASAFPLIAVEFPKFADGRGYSTARLLRERFGFKADIRATGDVLHDQLFFMVRCGFSSMDMRADQNLELAEQAFRTFTDPYQGDVNDPRPLFRRRHS